MKTCVSFHWTLFALCSLCVCVHVFALRGPVQLSGLVCRWLSWGLLKENVYLSLFPFLCHILVPSPAFFCAWFHLPVTPLTTYSLSSLHLLRAILGRGEFSSLRFLSPFFFMCLSGLSAAAIHGGFGMKCLLTEPCAPELR